MILFESDKFNDMEKAAIYAICTQMPTDVAKKLALQFEASLLKLRKMTGVGFFTNFHVPNTLEILPSKPNPIGSVNMEVDGLENGCGFLLFLKDGYIDFLECWIVDKAWPTEIKYFKVLNAQTH